jgi:Fe2+ transport system protein FeoA
VIKGNTAAGAGGRGASGAEVIPLSSARTGQQVRLVDVAAGHELRARVASMGLLPGKLMRVIRNAGGGPLVVMVHNTRLALGRGMVHRVMVTPVAPGAEAEAARPPKKD